MPDEKFMLAALKEAEKAASIGETPIGCVIVKDGKIISRAHNTRETKKNALHHAEILAINKACKKLGGWRLWQCDLYVTLEPCPMCAGAILQSRIRRVFIGAKDPKGGAMGSVFNLFSYPVNHKPEIHFGFYEERCERILRDFFRNLRENKKKLSKS